MTSPVAAAAAPVFATLDETPTLRLGSLDGVSEEQFGSVDDVLPLPDGGVAVLDGLAAEIRVFDAGGAFRMTLGSKGEGPGELRAPVAVGLVGGDTVAVYDPGTRRVTRFGPDGSLGGVVTLEETRIRTVSVAFLSDGRLVGQSRWLVGDRPVPGPEPTLGRDTVVLALFAADGTIRDTVDVLPGREVIRSVHIGDGFVNVFRLAPPFGRANVFATHPDGIWTSANDRFELRLRETGTGRLVRIVRAPGLEVASSEALADSIWERDLADAETPDERRRVEIRHVTSPRPVLRPAFDRLVVDDRGRLWVRAWSPIDVGTRWWVFAAAGDLLGSVDAPPGVTIHAVRCGSAWGTVRDELDVGYVVRHEIQGVDDCDEG